MCGIVGFVKQDSLADLYVGLKTLEYRGYDSAGVACICHNKLTVCKKKGRIDRLRAFLFGHHADVCMGHTRWATHGAPSAINAHPHVAGDYAVVHNGIITNYQALRGQLEKEGRHFISQTDTEVIAHLLDAYTDKGDVPEAIRRVQRVLKGSWAVAVLYRGTPDRLYVFKQGNPLIVGRGSDYYCFASDTPALVHFTGDIYKMQDGEVACIQADKATFWREGVAFSPVFQRTTLQAEEVQLGCYPHYMRKEMAEIPVALGRTARALSQDALPEVLGHAKRLVLTGCGTAYHACMYLAGLGLPVSTMAVVASEFDNEALGVDGNTVVVAVSQSGETADTLQAVRLARAAGATVIGITNVPQSGLSQAVDECLVTRAGAEIAVAATKSYTTQMLALRYLVSGWRPCPKVEPLVLAAQQIAARYTEVDAVARAHFRRVFLLAKGRDYTTCLEGALKIKEVTYLPCETCYAGEIKHGPLAGVTPHTLVVVVCTHPHHAAALSNAIAEVTSRGARVLAVTSCEICLPSTWQFHLPAVEPDWAPILAVMPLMYLSYRMAVCRRIDPDKPRNLAKSVTVQ